MNNGNGWDALNTSYWQARNAVSLAMVEQRLDRADSVRILMSLRDILSAATSDEQRADAKAAFDKTVEKYTEKEHAKD